jgi:AraC-like DNA-binding protein
MRKTPADLAETPNELALRDPRADFVGEVLGVSLLRHALYAPIEARAPWGLRIPRSTRASFYLVARGNARLEVADERPHVLAPGEIAFVPHGTEHVLRDSANSRPVTLSNLATLSHESRKPFGGRGATTSIIGGYFSSSPEQGAGFLDKMPKLVVLSASDPTSGPWVASAVQFILAESATSRPAGAVVIQRLADVLFILAVRSVAASGMCERSGLAAVEDPRIYRALNALHAHVARPWTVTQLARLVGMSRSGFAARFSELVGESPLQYLTRQRMARAAELLRTTTFNVESIAEQVGYTSVPAFSRVFKRWNDAGPAAFRRAHAAK